MSFVVRRIFDTDEGQLARWWMGPWEDEGQGFGEPEDAQTFTSERLAKIAFVGSFPGCSAAQRSTRGWSREKTLDLLFAAEKRTSVQSYEDALAEVSGPAGLAADAGQRHAAAPAEANVGGGAP